jgi:HSF-type DNA-binding
MINSCDADIACWMDEGETFVVKDPVRFEQMIIPQFFKHSKFSSFVRVSEDEAGTETAVLATLRYK